MARRSRIILIETGSCSTHLPNSPRCSAGCARKWTSGPRRRAQKRNGGWKNRSSSARGMSGCFGRWRGRRRSGRCEEREGRQQGRSIARATRGLRRPSLDARSLAQPCYLPEEIRRPPEREEKRDLRRAPPVELRCTKLGGDKKRKPMGGRPCARRTRTMKQCSSDARTMGHPTPGSEDTRPPIGKRSKERNRWARWPRIIFSSPVLSTPRVPQPKHLKSSQTARSTILTRILLYSSIDALSH